MVFASRADFHFNSSGTGNGKVRKREGRNRSSNKSRLNFNRPVRGAARHSSRAARTEDQRTNSEILKSVSLCKIVRFTVRPFQHPSGIRADRETAAPLLSHEKTDVTCTRNSEDLPASGYSKGKKEKLCRRQSQATRKRQLA